LLVLIHRRIGNVVTTESLGFVARLSVAGLAMAVVQTVALEPVTSFSASPLFVLALLGGLGLVVYGGLTVLLRVSESRLLIGVLRKRSPA
jgi:hypothetical protein